MPIVVPIVARSDGVRSVPSLERGTALPLEPIVPEVPAVPVPVVDSVRWVAELVLPGRVLSRAVELGV